MSHPLVPLAHGSLGGVVSLPQDVPLPHGSVGGVVVSVDVLVDVVDDVDVLDVVSLGGVASVAAPTLVAVVAVEVVVSAVPASEAAGIASAQIVTAASEQNVVKRELIACLSGGALP